MTSDWEYGAIGSKRADLIAELKDVEAFLLLIQRDLRRWMPDVIRLLGRADVLIETCRRFLEYEDRKDS
jgi:hypothetical protein